MRKSQLLAPRGRAESAVIESAFWRKRTWEDAATPIGAGTGGAVGGAAGGPHLGGLTIPLASSAAAGFAVVVVFRAIDTWGKIERRQAESPFRYLTILARNGVVFLMSQ
jgi:hypothetical protein